jgi:hypothetical protein
MSIQIDQALAWRGREVVDREGQKVGTFDEIYLDEGTNEPAWAAVKSGPFRLRRRVVPIVGVQPDGDRIRLPFTKDQVKSAPTIDSEGWVPERDQETIYRHYGVDGRNSGPPGSDEADAPPNRMQLKRYTVTETVSRQSEFGPE